MQEDTKEFTHFIEVWESGSESRKQVIGDVMPIDLLKSTMDFNEAIGMKINFIWFIKEKTK